MGNYLNTNDIRPSIFEIALSYENGNEGHIQPQDYVKNKYKGYKQIYDQLTEEEKELSYKHPFLAIKIKKNREKAFRATSHLPGITDGYGDAVRHCYWCALNQKDAGLNSSLAKEFGDAHENNSGNDLRARAMDLHNNAEGYKLGNQAIINGWSEEKLLDNVIKAANNGILKIHK